MRFDYYEPGTVDEAIEVLTSEGEAATILAGGTDLLLQMRRGLSSHRAVVNIKSVPGLNGIRFDASGGLTFGPLTTFRALETNELVRSVYPAVVEASQVVAGVQLRNLATVGGNLGNASPAADSVPPLVALGATTTIAGPDGTRTLPVEDCFLGPGETALAPNELFASINIPSPAIRSGNAYERFTPRSAMDIAAVSASASVALDESGRCEDCRIALGAVSPVPLRAREAEDVLRGEKVTPALLERIAELSSDAAEPITDIRGSAEYRRAIVGVVARRVVSLAAQRALNGERQNA